LEEGGGEMIRNFLSGEMVEIKDEGKVKKAQIMYIEEGIYTVRIEAEEGHGEWLDILEPDIIGYPGGSI
jgi:hypothetical protein